MSINHKPNFNMLHLTPNVGQYMFAYYLYVLFFTITIERDANLQRGEKCWKICGKIRVRAKGKRETLFLCSTARIMCQRSRVAIDNSRRAPSAYAFDKEQFPQCVQILFQLFFIMQQ